MKRSELVIFRSIEQDALFNPIEQSFRRGQINKEMKFSLLIKSNGKLEKTYPIDDEILLDSI